MIYTHMFYIYICTHSTDKLYIIHLLYIYMYIFSTHSYKHTHTHIIVLTSSQYFWKCNSPLLQAEMNLPKHITDSTALLLVSCCFRLPEYLQTTEIKNSFPKTVPLSSTPRLSKMVSKVLSNIVMLYPTLLSLMN